MIKIQIKNRFTGSIIFEHSKENNSLKETVKEYIKKELESGKRYANLSYANLSHANLSHANLSYANLSHANLSYANLSYTNLRSANLRSADLRYANLSYANLRYAENINDSYIQIRCKWNVFFHEDLIHIGCKSMTIKEWDSFFNSNDVFDTPRDTEDFKRIHANYLAYKAYYEFMNGKV